MTQLLLRLFIKNTEDLQNPKTRTAIGSLSGFVGIGCNLLLFTMKLIVGTLAASVSITADAMNNLSDATSSIVTLLGFKLAEKPADEDHPYGHARFEYLSGLGVAVMIIVIGFELAKSSVEKILNPTAVEFGFATCAVLLGSIIVKLWLAAFNGKLGKMIKAATLEATAADSRNDCIATFAVLLAALVESVTSWKIDGWMGLDPYLGWSEPIHVAVPEIDPGIFFENETTAYIVNNDFAPPTGEEYQGHRTIRMRKYDLVNDKLVELIRQIEAGQRESAPENIAELI